ncbi:glutamate-rich protein 2 isoform X2 [Rhinoderma darwinii]|uniref:glutamate-rich protein 2 isoform X2 n=1 Tax=Rhinoderma darwinii TaxID=43563 RepID=UPI003F66F6A8
MNRTEACGSASQVNLCKGLGKLEVLDPEDDDYLKASKSVSLVCNSHSPEFATKRPVSSQNGKLQVLGPKEEVVIQSYDAASSSDIPDYNVGASLPMNNIENGKMQKITSVPGNTDEKETTGPQSLAIHNGNIKRRLEESSDEDESDDETGRAPIELLAEFISAIMDKDYQVAQKLCQMILLYEPENPEAKQFSPLIEKMLQIEQQQSSEDEDSEDSDEETDEDTSDTDDDDDHCTTKHIS